MVTIRPHNPPSFLTPLGALGQRRKLSKKGFPKSLKNWRFLTVTFDRSEYDDPEHAYDVGKEHLREFILILRRKYKIKRWCWRLEFHEPNELGQIFPHWHLLLDYKRPIPWQDVRKAWGMGDVDIEGVRDAQFDYLFDYMSKELDQVPDWILSKHRVRFFQTSMGFYDKPLAADDATLAEVKRASPRPCSLDHGANTQIDRSRLETIGERLNRWSRSVVCRSQSGTEVRYQLRELQDGKRWKDVLVAACNHKFALNMGVLEITITEYKIEGTQKCLQSLPLKLDLCDLAYT